MKKALKVFLLMVICCTFLSGCVGMIADVRINEDGSGIVTTSMGYTAEAIEMLSSMGDEYEEFEYTHAFEYDGVTYYGTVESIEFANVDEYNLIEASDEGLNETDNGDIFLTRNDDGSFHLKVVITADETSTDSFISDADAEMEEELMNDMAFVIIYDFPHSVQQIAGPAMGVSVDGSLLTIDVLEVSKNLESYESATFEFKTVVDGKSAVLDENGEIVFFDVASDKWYHDAVYALAKSGVVNGVGDGRFAPEETLTYAQFCQILAGNSGLETGSANGYWAYKAIEACVDCGYIDNRGEYTPENYNVPILREAAVAAAYKASNLAGNRGITDRDIPDYAEIGEDYKTDILGAYNAGITTGIDANKTFNPKGELNRAEICQLFYNIK